MRFAAGIIGILGALAGLFLGYTWFSNLSSDVGQTTTALSGLLGEFATKLGGMTTCTYVILACGILGLAASILVMIRKFNRWANAVILVLCGIAPLLFSMDAYYGGPMTLAGFLAFAVKYETTLPEPTLPD